MSCFDCQEPCRHLIILTCGHELCETCNKDRRLFPDDPHVHEITPSVVEIYADDLVVAQQNNTKNQYDLNELKSISADWASQKMDFVNKLIALGAAHQSAKQLQIEIEKYEMAQELAARYVGLLQKSQAAQVYNGGYLVTFKQIISSFKLKRIIDFYFIGEVMYPNDLPSEYMTCGFLEANKDRYFKFPFGRCCQLGTANYVAIKDASNAIKIIQIDPLQIIRNIQLPNTLTNEYSGMLCEANKIYFRGKDYEEYSYGDITISVSSRMSPYKKLDGNIGFSESRGVIFASENSNEGIHIQAPQLLPEDGYIILQNGYCVSSQMYFTGSKKVISIVCFEVNNSTLVELGTFKVDNVPFSFIYMTYDKKLLMIDHQFRIYLAIPWGAPRLF